MEITKEPFFSENENIELFANFPWIKNGMKRNDRTNEPKKKPYHVR